MGPSFQIGPDLDFSSTTRLAGDLGSLASLFDSYLSLVWHPAVLVSVRK